MTTLQEELQAHLPGYSLVSAPEKWNTATKLHLRCPNGHDWSTARLGNIRNGTECPKCPKYRPNKLDTKTVSERLLGLGWELLGEYRNAHTRIKVRCKRCGGVRESQFTNIYSTCKTCRHREVSGETIDRLRSVLENRNHIILNEDDISESRLHSMTLEVRCQDGHVYKNTAHNIMSKGQSCPECFGNKRLTIEDIRSRLDDGYTVSGEYVNNKSSLLFRCPSGHEYQGRWSVYQAGYRCPECHKVERLTQHEVTGRIEQLGYKWVGGSYTNVRSILLLECKEHGTFPTKFSALYGGGKKCPACTQVRSGAEIEMAGWLSTHVEVRTSVRDILPGGQEIDIYCPNKKVGIEYCGLYYHNENAKHRGYHAEKYLGAKLNGVQLITVFEDEWQNRKDLVKSVVLSKMGMYSRSIYARQTELKPILKSEFRHFFESYHIQGAPAVTTNYAWGLYANGELLMAVSCSFGHRQNFEKEALYIDRVCSKSGVNVVGGFSKLLVSAKSYAIANDRKVILTWSDRRYSAGNMYQQNGFTLLREGPPDYSYVRAGQRKSKQSMAKRDFEKNLGTEHELRKAQGWSRIWDCGKDCWQLDLGSH